MARIYKGAFSGILPITISRTGSGVLASYRIFGNGSGVGVETEASGYKLPILSNSTAIDIYIGDTLLIKDEYVDSATGKIYRRTKNLSPPEEEWIDGHIRGGDGAVIPSTQIKVSPFIDVSTCETCIMEVFSTENEWAVAGYREMAFYNADKQYLGWIGGGGRQTLTPNSTERLSEFPDGTVYVRICCSHNNQPFYPQLVSGYTPTHQFYPYLVPTDPPAPFPQIPTSANSTTISWAGSSSAPSQFDGLAGWSNLPVRKLTGIPYSGTLPVTLTQTKAGYLYRYRIYGNTVQDGTPTPENPIVPSECGERTENLFLIDQTKRGYYESDGRFISNGNYLCSELISIENVAYTASFYNRYNGTFYFEFSYFDENYSFISIYRTTVSSGMAGVRKLTTDSIPQNAKYLLVSTINEGEDYMLNLGSTALPYEPYGYKLPLTANGVEYPIYLGESQTTRYIKRLVLTGDETWTYQSEYTRFMLWLQNAMFMGVRLTPIICTHYITIDDGRSIAQVPNNAIYIGGSSAAVQFFIKTDGYTTIADLKSFLAAQYAAGTPVTVWYVLAEPETGIVNEPLMKIGDYADTIDSEQTTVQIPTAAGETTISWAGEGLAPSQFDSIQEWVNIPAYTYTSGAWVAGS